ncbi:MAG: class I SAM-dependent methyltransferase [Chitinophagaceae bacterium]|nr:class I SAM-dependent methyltransferase [Chitinophagaceae bacterium]
MQTNPASYRDNSGFVFKQNDKVYRYIYANYEPHYLQLMNSGLYDELVKIKKLIPHEEIADKANFDFADGRILLPVQIPFISYPYEWSFDMWKDAALLTLQIALVSLKKEMILKDATPFNIQFINGKPVFIDTLSFENYEAGKPWIAYHQFSECFLAPLLLMHYCHPDTNKLFTVYPNGIPMDVLVRLLPKSSKWNMGTFLHVHLQAKFAQRTLRAGKQKQQIKTQNNFSRQKLELLLKGLESFVQKLSPKNVKTTWDDYYTDTILGDDYLAAKTTLVKSFSNFVDYKSVIDLGANDGHFSLLFVDNKNVIATDADSNCINDLYLKIRKESISNILPLVNDLTTPSPAIGWANTERESITTRLKADMVLALALVHHLAIAKNIPLHFIADWLRPMGEHLIIEFVPKDDEKVKLLLQNRKDIFDNYSLENFRSIFAGKYKIVREEKVGNTNRILFLMTRK